MTTSISDLPQLVAFVEGAMSVQSFEEWVHHDVMAAPILQAEEKLPPFAQAFGNLYQYLIQLDLTSPASVLDAQDVVSKILENHSIAHKRDESPKRNFILILKAQPKWLILPPDLAGRLLREVEHLAEKTALGALKKNILEIFQFLESPPKWLQAPEWQFAEDGRPLRFVGQIDITKLSHDRAYLYVFFDSGKSDFKFIRQAA